MYSICMKLMTLLMQFKMRSSFLQFLKPLSDPESGLNNNFTALCFTVFFFNCAVCQKIRETWLYIVMILIKFELSIETCMKIFRLRGYKKLSFHIFALVEKKFHQNHRSSQCTFKSPLFFDKINYYIKMRKCNLKYW